MKHTDHRGKLPLHIACATSNPLSGDIAVMLCRHFPDATKLEDGEPSIPIEYAIHNPSPTAGAVVAAVLREFPDGVLRVTRRRGAAEQASVIHQCASAGFVNRDAAALRILESLVKFNEQAARVADRRGRVPLHIAAENPAPTGLEVVRLLTRVHPDAAAAQDAAGDTPLHVAAAHSNPACVAHLVALERGATALHLRNAAQEYPTEVTKDQATVRMLTGRPLREGRAHSALLLAASAAFLALNAVVIKDYFDAARVAGGLPPLTPGQALEYFSWCPACGLDPHRFLGFLCCSFYAVWAAVVLFLAVLRGCAAQCLPPGAPVARAYPDLAALVSRRPWLLMAKNLERFLVRPSHPHMRTCAPPPHTHNRTPPHPPPHTHVRGRCSSRCAWCTWWRAWSTRPPTGSPPSPPPTPAQAAPAPSRWSGSSPSCWASSSPPTPPSSSTCPATRPPASGAAAPAGPAAARASPSPPSKTRPSPPSAPRRWPAGL